MYPCSSSFHMALHAEDCLFCWCRQNENSIVQACVLANTYKLLSALQSWHKRIIRITGRKYEVMGNRSLSTSCKEKENGRKGDTCLAFSNSASLRTALYSLFSTAQFNKLEHGEKVSLRWQRQILARMNSLCYISCMFRGIVVVASEVGTRDKPQMIFCVFLSKLHWYLFFCRLSAARQYFLAGYSLLFSVSYHHVLPRWF
jgi:hypothetical protein